jgi:hypothetical protein
MTSKIQVMLSVTVAMKCYLGLNSGNGKEESVTLKLTNVPSVTVTIKNYPERDSGNDGEEGVTTEINKFAKCDSDYKKIP